MANKPSFEQVLADAKQQLLMLVADARVPLDIECFAHLHDYCDANCLGGFCDDDKANEWIAAFGGFDEHESWPDEYHQFVVRVEAAVDEWIKAGGVRDAYPNPVWLLLETNSDGTSVSAFSSDDKAISAGCDIIDEYRNNSKVADEIDEVLTEFKKRASAGDGSAVFYVEVKVENIN